MKIARSIAARHSSPAWTAWCSAYQPVKDPAGPPFFDPGAGQREAVNLSDRRKPLVKLDAVAFDAASGQLALVGAATDNLLLPGCHRCRVQRAWPSRRAARMEPWVRAGNAPGRAGLAGAPDGATQSRSASCPMGAWPPPID